MRCLVERMRGFIEGVCRFVEWVGSVVKWMRYFIVIVYPRSRVSIIFFSVTSVVADGSERS